VRGKGDRNGVRKVEGEQREKLGERVENRINK